MEEMQNEKEPTTKEKFYKMYPYRGHFWFRCLFSIIVLLIVFWLGIMVGSFRHYHGRGFYGRGFGRYPAPMMQGYGRPMLRGIPYNGMMQTQPATSTPSAAK